MIVVDTGAIVALVDADDRHHGVLCKVFASTGNDWVLPWAILPEVDYILDAHVGRTAATAFRDDLPRGSFHIEWGQYADLFRSSELLRRYQDLEMGLVDSIVMATAERLQASAIVTLDLRDFGAVTLAGRPRLLPRDGLS